MFSNSVKLFSLLGFDVKLDPSWFLIATLIVWSLSTGYFPQSIEGETQVTYLLLAIVAMIGFFASLVLHELAHSVVARRYNVEIKGITLFVFGGVAELGSEPKTAGTEFWIAVAGPAMSFALSWVFWSASLLASALGSPESASVVLSYLAIINLILAVFNLLPAFPLDGGRVYRAVLWNKTGDFFEATQRASDLGSKIAYALIALGLFLVFSGYGLGGLWQVFIGLFLLSAAKGTYHQMLVTSALSGKTVSEMMSKPLYTVTPDKSLSELVNLTMLRHRMSFVPVVEGKQLLGYIDGEVLGRIDRENWSNTQVGDVFVALSDENSVAGTVSAHELFTRMSKQGRRKFLVATGDQLLGVITLSDLMEYLAVLQQVGPPPPRMRTG
jgi:Zn-dependent protease/predicted transcriptional regulator